MDIKLINDDNNTLTIKLLRYDYDTIKKEDSRRGVYFIQSEYRLYTPKSKILEKFLKDSYEIFIELHFDGVDGEGRVKKIYSPSIELTDDYLLVEKLNEFLF